MKRCTARGRREGVGGGGDASGMCTGRDQLRAVGARARAERTKNMPLPLMPFMFVTLDVSKLSGWLNALALCRAEMGARTMRGDWCLPGGGWV